MRTRVLRAIITIVLASIAGITLAQTVASGRFSTEKESLPPVPATEISQTGVCSYPDPPQPLVTDLMVYQTPNLSEPPARAWFRDPVFGTCITRVTNRARDLIPGDPSAGLKNEYARVQSFNADGTRLLLYSVEGYWYLYSAESFHQSGELPLYMEPRWDPGDPNVIYSVDETRLVSYNIQTANQVVVHDFATDIPGQEIAAVWTRYEGRPTRDGRYWGLVAQNQDWIPVAFLVYDRWDDQVIIRNMRGVPAMDDGIDHVTISPLGAYFLASYDRYCERGRPGDDADPCGLMVYDHNLANGRNLLRVIGHYDVALDALGREVIVYQDIDTDHISMLDLESGSVTPLWEIDFSHSAIGLHFSGHAFDQPGWALVSTYNGAHPADATWMDDQVFAVELQAGGSVVRLAHTHSLVDEEREHDYWAEPHASVNRDFSRVVFTSNWGRSGNGEVEVYLIDLPPDWIERVP